MTVHEFIAKKGSHKQAKLDAMELVNCKSCDKSESTEFYQEVLDTADDLLLNEMDKIKSAISPDAHRFLLKIHYIVNKFEEKYCMSDVYFRHVQELRETLGYVLGKKIK